MIRITDKHDCCGCGACAQRCPQHCITMKADGEGFVYPEVDASACTDCGLCERVCPLLDRQAERAPQASLAVKNRDEADRAASSSGGVFIALARKVVADGGVVYGAVFDDGWQVRHTSAESGEALRPMMGSKYVQSSIGDTYTEVENNLKKGRRVMFAGTPCQIAGLRSFLRRDYDNLLLVDILCHGVPSPAVWHRYLEENFTGADASTEITSVNFRDKRREGWSRYNVVVSGRRCGDKGPERCLSAAVYVDNPYMVGLMNDVYLRPACHKCVCKHGASGSDLTIGDYWGVARYMPDFDDDRGVSYVGVYTDKGRRALDGIDADMRQAVTEGIETGNAGFSTAAPEHRYRARFFRDVASGLSFDESLDRALHVPLWRRTVKMLRKGVRRIIKGRTK